MPSSTSFVVGSVRLAALALVFAAVSTTAIAKPACRSADTALADARDVAGVRGAVARACPCDAFDGTARATRHGAYVRCAKAVINDAARGTPVTGGYTLRRECKAEVTRIFKTAACGYDAPRVQCCQAKAGRDRSKAKATPPEKCVDSRNGKVSRTACWASPFATDACTFDGTSACRRRTVQETFDIPSAAMPAHTPGTPGVAVTNEKLLTHFGGTDFSLNNARYTRHRLAGPAQQPDAVLILVPGFEGGAGDFTVLAQNVIERAAGDDFILEVWAVDRRTNQLEDTAGLDVAEEFLDPQIALDWLYGGELGLPLHPALVAGPNRRSVFYDAQGDVPFIANWTNLVFSRDIDALVVAARAVAQNANVFLGGHSAGTGFTARYAATDFDLAGGGPADPGYAKLRGLVLLEGSGGRTDGPSLTDDSLDRIEAKFDGALFGAVRDGAPRCVDGTTSCTIDTEATDCAGQTPPKCTPSTAAYAVVPGLLNPRIMSAGELSAIQGVLDPDGGENVIRADQGAPGNNAVEVVPDLATLAALPRSTALAGLGGFLDDDGVVATIATFVATSVGAPGPVVNGLQTWQDITQGPLPDEVLPDNGPPPTSLPAGRWGQEKEVSRLDRVARTFYEGGTNFTDLYYPSAGQSITSAPGRCVAATCTAGNVGADCENDGDCGQSIGLDSSALSIGRGRRDIENLTQAANIDIPVLAVCGSNGSAPVPGVYTPFARSIGTCTAPSCDGTPRVVDEASPNPAFPTFGGGAGGYEVVVAEGFAHVDVLTAEDDVDNPIPAALVAFLKRNVQ